MQLKNVYPKQKTSKELIKTLLRETNKYEMKYKPVPTTKQVKYIGINQA